MLRLVRSRRWERVGEWGHANSATAPDVAGPGKLWQRNFNIWKLNPSFGGIWNASIRLRTGDTADEVESDCDSVWEQFWYPSIHYVWSVLFSFLGEADVRAELVGSLLPYQYRNEITIICIFSVLLCIRSLLNNEPSTSANLILDLFADVLNQSRSDVCGLTDIHKSTYKLLLL